MIALAQEFSILSLKFWIGKKYWLCVPQEVVKNSRTGPQPPHNTCPQLLGSNPALGKQWSHDYPIDVPATPTLPNANLRYQEALDWSKWTKGGCSFLLLSTQF